MTLLTLSLFYAAVESVHGRIVDGFRVQTELPVKPDSHAFVCAGETAWFILLEDLDVFLQG